MNKKENPGVSRRGAAMLLLFSLAVSVLLGFAMPVHAADDSRTTLRTLRVGFYPYTGYMATAADGSRSGYAYELLQDIAQHENVTFAYSCLNGNTQQAMQQLAAGQIDLIPVLRRIAVRAGTVDAYYTYTYQAERTVFDDTRNELPSMLSGEQRNFCIGVRQDYDVLLRTVLNKSIDSLTRAEISTITNAYVNLGQQPFSLTRLAYQYPAIIVLTCLCVLVTAVCIALVIRAQRFRAETEKALRKAEEASVAKTEFLSNMSHDIRTPINGIMGMLDIAEDNFDNKARVRDCMTKMRGAASHLLSLINDVLDMTKIESGNMQMLDTSFDLRALLDSCCSIVEGQIVDRHMTFTKQIGPFWHPYLIGSELHIRQVLINILSNAVKYTPDGGEINFRAKETLFEEGLVHLRMEIKDNGIGMSEEFLQHIFEPFTQEQRSSRTHYKGTGLGMAITKKLVDQMHGSLDVESEPGKGSTIIAMTANVFADDVKACLDAGMNSHVGKPLDMKVLIGVILKYTDAR